MTKDGSKLSLAVRKVRSLLDRHGLPRHRQSAWLANATGISYSQAHRRLNDASPWTLEELAEVAEKFGETLVDLLLASEDAPRDGLLQIGSASLRCTLWLGESEKQSSSQAIVAVHTSSGWRAVQASEAGDGPIYRVERIDIRPALATRKRVAVLDDDHDITDAICAHLGETGYEAFPFYRSSDLASSVDAQTYDAFVLDWIVDESNVLGLVAKLRALDAVKPIVVLTAQVVAGVVEEQEIAAAVQRHGLVFHEKPVRLSILSATLARALPQQA